MNLEEISILTGGQHFDERGKLSFFNDFDMTPVKRFYIIEPVDSKVLRTWQRHKIEQKWFFAIEGSFMVVILKPDSWGKPSESLELKEFILIAGAMQVLHIPGGWVNGFRAVENNSKLMIFSDFSIGDAVKDDFRFDKRLWFNWEV